MLFEEFNQIIKTELRKKKLNVDAFSKQINISCGYLYELLGNRKRWNQEQIEKVSKALNIQVKFESLN